MCHLPLVFALIVYKFSLEQSNAAQIQLNLLTIIYLIGLSPLVLLLLTKLPIQFSKGRLQEQLVPVAVVLLAILLQLKELNAILGARKLSTQGFTAQDALIPVLILSEAISSLRPTLPDKYTQRRWLETLVLGMSFLLLLTNVFELMSGNALVIHAVSVSISIATTALGLLFFYLSKFKSQNSKMLGILLYYCLQSAVLSFIIPSFDSLLNNSILYLGVIFALTIDAVFLNPTALVENGFSMSVANRRLRDDYERRISDTASLAAATLDSLSARICILNSEGIITSVNRAWRQFSPSSDELGEVSTVGQNYLDSCRIYGKESKIDLERLREGIRAVLSGKQEEFVGSYPLQSSTGKRWLLSRVTSFETSLGRCATVAHEDVTELKTAEEELLLKTAAIERANDGIVLSDPSLPDYPVVYVSPGFLKLTGYAKEDILGRNCRILQGPDTDPKTLEKIREALKNQRPFIGDIVNYTKTGQAWINRLRLEPIFDENGKLLRYLGVQSNVTEQRKLEEERNKALEKERISRIEVERHFQEAKAANTLKDEFLATLSHELRTPAGVIGGFVELLKYENLSPAEQTEALDAIERNSRSLITLIDDILDVSRVITGKFKLNPKPVDLASVVESVISAELLAAQAKNIRIVTEFEPGLGPVYGDTTRLQQIFWNLMSNAIKFTPRNGRVKVTLRMDGSRAVIRVSDTGVGIDPKFLPHVFDRFRQQDSGMNRAYGGLGLGLSIVKHLVELHGGAVWAESEGTGMGSTFTVSLPILTSSG